MTIRHLSNAFAPASVALVGASSRPGSVGRQLLRNLLDGGFEGSIWPVNGRYEEIDGHRCYASIEELPGVPDLAVIATRAVTVPEQIAKLAEFGCRAAVVVSAGIHEQDGLQQKMLDAARPHCFRIIGPNCIGICVPPIGLNASFSHLTPQPGKLAFLSQSGALTSAVLDWAAGRQVGFSYVVSMGDMADVDVGDLLDFLAGDPNTSTILMYLETITDAGKFMSAARSAARVKPVVVIKSGRNTAAAEAAATHTGALAGADEIADAAFRRAGLLRVNELEELFDAAESLTRLEPLQGERLCILTNGGGAGVLAVDSLFDRGGRLATLSAETIKKLGEGLPDSWSHANPVDIIGDAGAERYSYALDVLLDDPGLDAVLVMNCPTAVVDPMDAAQGVFDVIEARQAEGRPLKPILANWLGEYTARNAREAFARASIPSYNAPADAIRGFSYLTDYAKAQNDLTRTPPSLPGDFKVDASAARKIISDAYAEGRTMLTEPEAKAVFAAFGVPVVQTRIVSLDPDEVEAAAAKLLANGDAVVLKILSEDLSHKSDVGGVRLNLRDANEVRRASELMVAHLARIQPQARLQGFTVQPMVRRPKAHELIIGMTEDRLFGPALMFGAGGTSVEVVGDKAFALPPLDLKLARDLMESTQIFKLLAGYRDRPAADLHAIALTLVRLSQLIVDCPEVTELDINPLLADEKGVIAIDARIGFDPARIVQLAPNRRLAIRPYPSRWERVMTTRSGVNIFLRPVLPSDEALFADFIAHMTPEDKRFRFINPPKEFSHGHIARFTQIDYARAMAFVAFDETRKHMLGLSRLTADADYQTAEFAVVVRPEHKGAGIGGALMQQLISYAEAEGLKELHGRTLSGNTTLLHLADEFGFKVIEHDQETGIVSISRVL